MPSKKVTMVHKDLPDEQKVVGERAFEAVWSKRGWKLAKKSDQPDPAQQ